MKTVKQALTEAAGGSESTATSTSIIRPSKAGAPLLVHVVEALSRRLPQPPPGSGKKDQIRHLGSIMSTGNGYLFENAVEDIIVADHPGHSLIKQPALEFGSFVGTADYLLLADDRQSAVVIDCKAFGCDTLREINERKLNANWGYRTQLAIYTAAVRQTHGVDIVRGMWYAWSSTKRKLFKVELPAKEANALAYAAVTRVDRFQQVMELAQAGAYHVAATLACSEPLVPKDYFYGNLCASTGFHYHPLSLLFYPDDNDGYPLEPSECVPLVEAIIRAAFTGSHSQDFQQFVDELFDTPDQINVD